VSDLKDGPRRVQREILPIPDQQYAGFVAYDAKDPDSKFAPKSCDRRKARLTS